MKILRGGLGTFIFSIGLVFASGCNDDELKGLVPDTFSVEEEDYKLSKGVLIDYGINPDGEGHDYDIFLASEDIRIAVDGESDFLGKGDAIYLDLSTAMTEQGLAAGDYSWDSPESNSFVEGLIYLDFDFESGDNEALIAERGVVLIDTGDEGYSIRFVMQLNDGKVVKGAYSGLLEEMQG